MNPPTTHQLADLFKSVIEEAIGSEDAQDAGEMLIDEVANWEEQGSVEVHTYQQVGMMTRDDGLVLRIGDSEFQITMIRSK